MNGRSGGTAALHLLLLAALLAAAPQSARAQELSPRAGAAAADREIAAGYLRQARQAFAAGRLSRARELLEVSLEFDPRSSESAYLYARTLLAEQRGSYRAAEYLRLALEADTWTQTRPLEAVAALAGFYARTGAHGQAARLLESLDRTESPALLAGATTAALAGIWADTLIAGARRQEAEAYLRRALTRFPESADLYLRLARLLEARGRSAEAAEVLSSGARLLPEQAELALALAALQRTSAGRLQAVDRYLAMGGADPAAALIALRADPPDPERYFEEFLRLGGQGRVADLDALLRLVRERAAAGGAAGGAYGRMAARLVEALGRYTGESRLDADGDGLYEELYEYVDGQLRRWHLDADQDGRREAEVAFQGGLPAAVVLNPDRGLDGQPTVELRYDGYPALAEVSFRDEHSRRLYHLLPGKVRAAAFAAVPAQGAAGTLPAGPLQLRYRGGLPQEESLVRRQSYRMDEYAAGSEASPWPQRRQHLLDGAVVRVEQSPDRQGVYRHVLHYGDSGPVEGRRDRDGDGRWELRERYAGGELTGVWLDADGDGVEEFAQSLQEGRLRLWWDYDGDGRYDSTQYEDAQGQTVREYSSRLDGVYDLRAVFRGERLVRLQRGERTLAVTRDARRGLFWVGKTPALPAEALDALAKLPAGAHTVAGHTLYVFRFQGELYVGEYE